MTEKLPTAHATELDRQIAAEDLRMRRDSWTTSEDAVRFGEEFARLVYGSDRFIRTRRERVAELTEISIGRISSLHAVALDYNDGFDRATDEQKAEPEQYGPDDEPVLMAKKAS